MPGSLTLTRDQVRALDRRAIEEYGVPSLLLMENAGRACADEAQGLLGDAAGDVLVLCGPGNNGGDGLVIARTLVNRGREARVVFVGPADGLEGGSADVRTNLRLWRGLGREVSIAADADALADLSCVPLVVDALFGTGLARPLAGPWAGAVGAVNDAGRPVLAVDLPSGLDADTGEVLGAAVRATCTVTFVARKPGCDRGEGPALCGRVVVAEIGIPRPLLDQAQRSG